AGRVPQLDTARLAQHLHLPGDAGVAAVLLGDDEAALAVELDVGRVSLEHANDVVVRLTGAELVDQLLHDVLVTGLGPEGEAAIPGGEHAAAGVLEVPPVVARQHQPALVVERPVVRADEHQWACSPWSAPLLSTRPHRMPLRPTGQGMFCSRASSISSRRGPVPAPAA